MNRILSIFSLCFIGFSAFAQLQIKPEHPTSDDRITIEYTGERLFETSARIICVAYFTGINDRLKERQDFPMAIQVPLTKSATTWLGEITTIPNQSTAIVFAFTDSLNHRDTNENRGYYTALYSNGQPLPGASAGVGSLLYGNWITERAPHHIRYDFDSLKKFFMKDFVAHPDVKREYFKEYLDILKLTTPEDERLYRKELQELGGLPRLTKNELLTLGFQYGRLKDTVNANKYNREVYKNYPASSWTLEGKSMKLLMTVAKERDFKKQAEAYQTFKTTYLKPNEEERATASMNRRAGQMLSYMVGHFADDGTMDLWIKEVDALSDDGKKWAYTFGARELLGLQERPTAPISKSQTVEHPFLVNDVEDPTLKVKIAGDLATRALEAYRNSMNEPRRVNEPLIMTDSMVKEYRYELMSGSLEVLGISLMRQNRFSEAAEVMTGAVHKNHFKESSINQTFIESLVRAGEIDKALSEIERLVSMGKSTKVIDSFYAKYKKKEDNIKIFQTESIELAKESLKNRIVKEDMPDFVFYDLNGKEFKSSSLKNKVVVIDFWASWCGPCTVALEANDQVIDKYKQDSEVVFLLIGEDDSKEKALKVINKHKNKESFVFDKNRELVKKVAGSLPTQLVIDKKGKVRFRTNGLTTFNVQENMIELEAMIEMAKGN